MFEKQSVELVESSIPEAELELTDEELVELFRDLPKSATYGFPRAATNERVYRSR